MTMKTKLAAPLLGAAVLAVATIAAAKADDAPELRIGVNPIYSVANTFTENGDDKSPAANLTAIRFSSVPDMLNALRAGQIDVAEVGAVGPIIAQAAGTPFKIVAVTQPWPHGEAIIVAADSALKTVEDLRGKKVAYGRATNSQWLVVEALASKGMTLKDIQPTFLPPNTNLLGALQAGSIDATAFIDVPLASYEAQSARRIADHGDFNFPIALQFIASNEAMAKKKPAIAAYVRALDRHLAWAHDHPQKRADSLAKTLHLDPAIVLVAEKRRPMGLRPIDPEIIGSNQKIADSFAELREIPQKLDVKQVFTTEFNDQLKR